MDFTLQKSAYPGQKTGSHLLKVTEAQGTQAGIRLRALAVKAAEAKSSRTILKQTFQIGNLSEACTRNRDYPLLKMPVIWHDSQWPEQAKLTKTDLCSSYSSSTPPPVHSAWAKIQHFLKRPSLAISPLTGMCWGRRKIANTGTTKSFATLPVQNNLVFEQKGLLLKLTQEHHKSKHLTAHISEY